MTTTTGYSQRRIGGFVGVTASETREIVSGVHGESSDKAHAPVKGLMS
jgi:hypothetical protein